MSRFSPAETSDGTDHKWIATIERAQKSKAMRAWHKACEVIRKKYRYEDSLLTKQRKYALLWSNTQTMQGATYVKPPKAEVARRYRDKDDTARQATLMVERCINYTFDAENYDGAFKLVRNDYILFARGQARVVYEPVMEAVALPDDGLDGADVEGVDAELSYIEEEADEEDLPDADEILTFERVKLKFVQREDFAHSPARIWPEVTWVAFRSFLDRDELRKRFKGKLGDEIPLTAKSDSGEGDKSNENNGDEKAEIWEVWDKAKNQVSWYAVGWPDVLEESEPYLKFADFFPCPEPAYGTTTSDTLAPRPDYIFYQDQAEQIDRLTARIDSLQDSLKIVGFYPAGPAGEGSPEIERAATPGVENKLIAVKSWAMFTEGGKGGVPIVFYPIEVVAKVLEGCVKMRAQLIEDVNQIYGITDIMRGQGDPNETATAQSLKTQGGSLRIRTRQAELARFCRDITRLVGEVICNHFQPETIMAMSNMPLPSDAAVLQQIQAQQQQQAMQQAMQAHQAALQQQQAAAAHQAAMQQQGGQSGQPAAPNGPAPAPTPAPPPPGPSPMEQAALAEAQQRMMHAHEKHVASLKPREPTGTERLHAIQADDLLEKVRREGESHKADLDAKAKATEQAEQEHKARVAESEHRMKLAAEAHKFALEEIERKKQPLHITRDEHGKVTKIGERRVTRDEDGRLVGIE